MNVDRALPPSWTPSAPIIIGDCAAMTMLSSDSADHVSGVGAMEGIPVLGVQVNAFS